MTQTQQNILMWDKRLSHSRLLKPHVQAENTHKEESSSF